MSDAPGLFADGELADAPSKSLTDALAAWNEFATQYKWKEARVLDTARRTALKRALKDYGGLIGFREALGKVAKNRFVQGMIPPKDGYKQFTANLDWFMRPVTVRKILEDFYEDEGADKRVNGHAAPAQQESEEEIWKRWLAGYRPKRFWPGSQGPRPEDPACHCPAGLLAWWREQHGVAAPSTVKESRRDRLEGLVRSYERVGKYADRNRCEEELAKLEGRPAVLVPAPSVAHLTGAGSDRRHETRVRPVVFDIPPESPADRERAKRTEFERLHEAPAWDSVPEGQDELEGSE